ncbi:7-carboxy-7-deazaguanine synthase QueE [bacterium]|nr:7-carboxy-7-deazaguanine synthase QueE [bacterium]
MEKHDKLIYIMKVNEIFYSLAGEGIRTGQATIFIRLSGCNLKCRFCDTRHDTFTEMTEEELAAEVNKYPAEWVTLTGGEPTLQDCDKLIKLLKPKHKISIETNGIRYVSWLKKLDLVTVSPKNLFHPKAHVDERIWNLPVVEAKFVITRPEDLESVLKVDRNCPDKSGFGNMLFLQPMNNDPHITTLCVEAIKANPQWRLSLQMHKLINIP